ncbi:MAG: co-chaperone GroES [Candidatus Dadabacteria bacterium]|nr:MAG: co-chaperone GroES [Candidatus Dadabacteria bacterium]
MTTKIRPLQDRIIVKRLDAEEKTSGGLYIPDSAKDKPQHGKVIAVGKGRIKEDGTVVPVELKEGDQILFGKYAGTEIKVEDQEYLIMREDDVLGIVEQ